MLKEILKIQSSSIRKGTYKSARFEEVIHNVAVQPSKLVACYCSLAHAIWLSLEINSHKLQKNLLKWEGHLALVVKIQGIANPCILKASFSSFPMP